MGADTRQVRARSIRLTLASLFIIPLVTLVALWGFAASVTLADSIAKRSYDTQNTDTGAVGQALLVQLGQERLQSFIWLGSDRRSSHTPVEFQREHTDAAVIAFRNGAGAAEGVMSPATKQSLAAMLARLGQLPAIRNAIDSGTMNAPHAFQVYNGIVDAEFRFFNSQAAINDISLYQEADANIEMGRALEMVRREAALVGAGLAAHKRMTPAGLSLFVQTMANQRFLEGEALSQLNGRRAGPYKHLFASPAYTSFKAMENQIAGSARASAPIPVKPAAWQAGVQSFLTDFNHASGLGRQAVTQGLRQVGSGIRLRLALAGGAGLLAVLISTYLLLRFGRRITRELIGLHEAARKLADERLPWVVSRLRHGEDVDVSAEAPPLTPGKTTEIAKVAAAFSTVQRTAVEAAVGQAQLRKGVNKVFLNLARRNQSLLHRQLDMLDSMERRTADPAALEDFFRLDHLTTRMRRHAESLIILSGEVPGRGWRSPVRILDVLRGAIAEIEDYVRVDVVSESRDAVVGTAVADVIHLLAELIENATAFSPPNTRITVTADRVGSGFVVEIEDRGLGITAEELAAINKRLASPPEFDLADSDRLGLFVVGQLAARHRIKVSLVESPFGGATAVVLMPHNIVVPESGLEGFGGNGHGVPAVAGSGNGLAMPLAAVGSAAWDQGPWQHSPAAEGRSGMDGTWLETQGESAGLRPVTAVPPAWVASLPPPATSAGEPPTAWQDAQAQAAWPDYEVQGAWPESQAQAAWPGSHEAAWPGSHEAEWPDSQAQAAWPDSQAQAAEPEPPGGPSARSAAYQRKTPMHAAARAGSGGAAGTYKGLPRRVRQASLAPQLRNGPAPDNGAAGHAGTLALRSAEAARAVMSSPQEGWQRGRADVAAPAQDDGSGGAADGATDHATDDATDQVTDQVRDSTAGDDSTDATGDAGDDSAYQAAGDAGDDCAYQAADGTADQDVTEHTADHAAGSDTGVGGGDL
jgi:signal transduction histidine kinase